MLCCVATTNFRLIEQAILRPRLIRFTNFAHKIKFNQPVFSRMGGDLYTYTIHEAISKSLYNVDIHAGTGFINAPVATL